MRVYHLSFDDVLALHPRRFWFLLNQATRLLAEEALMQMRILGSVNSAEAFEKTVEELTASVGEVFVWEKPGLGPELRVEDLGDGLDPEFDREALQQLKRRLAAQR